ncbi:cation diffusion facilitator family transporter [Bergeyella cardium]|uniref:Cation diffusion facilitator family transporter n=1 Tax=Bergeyella cardium TaxID=1585976 RepID=A0A6P1QU27_9FLAO|nr:cation diffusion facilitator family transporter [Bergeyella cardium]QHN65642.1 cation diffusion facilitator family transporter [Bergeyella cardium]WHE33229.1 cation diffusion facilitator family transporter [Bergeyella cardium]WHF59879.1 cation diffusion facilitator family transporter [Bergeyella cardium]
MEHSHEGHCHHSVSSLDAINRAFYIGIGLNLLYTIVEYGVGFSINSLALISDASHNLSDVASLIISLLGMKLAQKAASRTYTYGYKKASILASLINAILLVFIVANICIEAVERLSLPPNVKGLDISITAFVGVMINSISAFLFYKGQKQDINIKGAFLHLMVDALVSVGVIISGVIISLTGWNAADIFISFVIAAVILISTWHLLTESLKLILDGVPADINTKEIQQAIEQHPMIDSLHHLHIWAMSSSQNALTAHIVLAQEISLADTEQIKKELRHTLAHKNIHHSTFEMEVKGCHCKQEECD